MYPAVIGLTHAYRLTDAEKKELLARFSLFSNWHPNQSTLDIKRFHSFISGEDNPLKEIVKQPFHIDVKSYHVSTDFIAGIRNTSEYDQHLTFHINVQVIFEPIIILAKLAEESHLVAGHEYIEPYKRGEMIPVEPINITAGWKIMGYQKL